MKKILVLIIAVLIGNIMNICFGGLDSFDVDSSSTIEGSIGEVINTDGIGADPLRTGTNNIGMNINSPINEQITTSTYAESRMVMVTRNAVNYFLGFLGLVALIYLIYNGFGILTAGGDDTKASKGYKGINYSLYALLGVGFTWILVSFAIYLVNKFFIGS